MNYTRHYELLIARARGRFFVGYRERHHVLPRCMGGTDAPENIVELTAEEHFVAHQLLAKMRPDVRGLIAAAVRMSRQCTGRRAFSWLRRRLAVATADRMRGNTHTKGRPLSPEHRAKMSATLRGRKLPARKPEHTEKIAAKNRGRRLSAEHREKLSAVRRGRVAWNKGKKHSAETIAKMSAAHMGNPSNLGRRLTQEHRAKVSASLIGNQRRAGMAPWNKGVSHG